jgi:hypothetical protein
MSGYVRDKEISLLVGITPPLIGRHSSGVVLEGFGNPFW